jgi:Kip1 ubiquitination-promoting complex protein 1
VLHRPDQQAAMFAAASYGAALLLSAMARRGAGEEPGTSRAASVSDIADSVDAEAEAEAEAFPSREEEASSVEASSSASSDRAEHENFSNASVDDVSVGDDPEKNRGALLPHVPAYHLESLIDSFHALRRGDPPFAPGAFAAPMPGLHSVVRLLVRHFHDDRVVNPDIRDAMLQSISVLLQYREYVDVFEKNDEARDAMVPALLRAFDSRFWIPVSNILLRLCRGAGFGQGAHKHETRETGPPLESRDTNSESAVGADADTTAETAAAPPADPSGPDAALARALASPQPEGASPLFQRLLVDTCRSDSGLLAEFLDRLFNTLNWTVTEFGVTLKEALEGASRARQHETRQRRRKCAVMFELSVTLTRVLEFLTKELPEVFLKAHSLDLKRLTETLVFVLGHTTAGPDAALFDRALLAQIAPSDKVSRAAILAPVAGIVLNLDAASQDAAERLGVQASQNTDGNSASDTSGELDDVTDTDKTAFLCVESIAAELARSNADVAQLEFLRDFPWTDHFSFPGDENETSGEPLNSEKSSDGESLKEKSSPVVLARLRDFVRRVRATREDVDRLRDVEDARSIPDEFVDPIMQTVMSDPVTLPGSGQVVDRATIRRHLLGDRTDPFSRSPLDETMLVPADDLRLRIEKWREEAPAAHSLADID